MGTKKNKSKKELQDWHWQKAPDCYHPALYISNYAWAKIKYINDKSLCEVGGFGITRKDNLLYVRDFVMPKQEVSAVTANLDDEGVADYYDNQIDKGLQPFEFGRIWIHTHPEVGKKNVITKAIKHKWHVSPTGFDEETYERCFGKCDWSIMMVVSGDSESVYVRLTLRKVLGINLLLPTKIVGKQKNFKKYHKQWDKEYEENVTVEKITIRESWPCRKDDIKPIGTVKSLKILDRRLDPDIDTQEFSDFCWEWGLNYNNMNKEELTYWQIEYRTRKEQQSQLGDRQVTMTRWFGL